MSVAKYFDGPGPNPKDLPLLPAEPLHCDENGLATAAHNESCEALENDVQEEIVEKDANTEADEIIKTVSHNIAHF